MRLKCKDCEKVFLIYPTTYVKDRADAEAHMIECDGPPPTSTPD